MTIPRIVRLHVFTVLSCHACPPEKRGEPEAHEFYIERLRAVPLYGEKSGTELLKCICRCAFADNVLTEAESISIINICHSPEWYKIFKEMNFNEGWN